MQCWALAATAGVLPAGQIRLVPRQQSESRLPAGAPAGQIESAGLLW